MFFLYCFAFTQAKSELCVYGLLGSYQGTDVYVQNPFDQDGVGFSIKAVEINGAQMTQKVFSSAFKIDLSKYNLNIGDSVSILFYYNSIEPPKIVNTEALTPVSNANIQKLWIENDSVLNWCSTDEQQKFDYIIEQYRWNKWIKLGEVKSHGTTQENCYSFIVDLHSGENKFRLVRFGLNGQKKTSMTANIESMKNKIQIVDDYIYDGTVQFSYETLYEVYNVTGELVLKGYNKIVEFCGLPKGIYFVNYGTITGDVFNLHHYISCE